MSPSSRNLDISLSASAPPLPITHAFGFVSQNPNRPQELVRTHSSQPISHGLHSSISAFDSTNGINSNVNGQITSHRHADDDHSSHIPHNIDVNIQSPPADLVQARFVENENHGVHEINSRTQHFEYKVPLIRTLPHEHEHIQHQHIPKIHHNDGNVVTKHVEFNQRNAVFKHSTYGVPSQNPSEIPQQSDIPSDIPSFVPSQDEPTFIPSQDEIDALPVFQNDKFLSPVARHTNTITTISNIGPPAQTIENIFDTSFHSNNPTTNSRVNNFVPSAHHSRNHPTTRTSEHFIEGNNRYSNRFSLSDGTKVSEQGKLISPQVGWENVISKTGEYEYVSPEGQLINVKWIADHEGFRVLN